VTRRAGLCSASGFAKCSSKILPITNTPSTSGSPRSTGAHSGWSARTLAVANTKGERDALANCCGSIRCASRPHYERTRQQSDIGMASMYVRRRVPNSHANGTSGSTGSGL
jgi:hypothetical protein